MAKVGESPHVSEAHREAHLGQDVLQLAVPRRPAIVLGDFYLRALLSSGRSHIQGAALVIERLLVGKQVGHRLCDVLMALLALYHLAVLRHQGGCGGMGIEREKPHKIVTERSKKITDRRGVGRRGGAMRKMGMNDSWTQFLMSVHDGRILWTNI